MTSLDPFKVVFNTIFNSDRRKCNTMSYWVDLLLNSLSSTYSYNHHSYKNLLRKVGWLSKDLWKEKHHEPSVIRQTVFYLIITTENLALTAYAAFYAEDEIKIYDGFQNIDMPYSHLCYIIIAIWVLSFIQLILLIIYYATHPSSVSIKDYKPKLKVYIFGFEVDIPNWSCVEVADAPQESAAGSSTQKQNLAPEQPMQAADEAQETAAGTQNLALIP